MNEEMIQMIIQKLRENPQMIEVLAKQLAMQSEPPQESDIMALLQGELGQQLVPQEE